MATRAQMWEKLGEDVDFLVIGGGINGAGIARDAAQRGLRVAVVELGDIASGTSSRSSKLVHGGVRYLEMLEFGLVFESVSERRILLDLAPHLVNPLGFLFPVYKTSRRSLTAISAGLWIYEGLALFRSPKRPRKLKKAQLAKEEPTLNLNELTGAPLYYDCATDDARLTLENAIAAVEDGATFVTYAKATGFEYDEDGKINAVHVEDQNTGEKKLVRARCVINATGPWTDRTLHMNPAVASSADLLRPTKGVHIVVPREVLPVNNAVVCFHPVDTRVLFALPWGDCTYVGTTDTDYTGDPADCAATGEDIDYLIAAAKAYFPDSTIRYEDIHCTWAGLRPLMRPPESDEVSESSVSREHSLTVGVDGMVTIAGGKLTTYRRMCEEVVDKAIQLLKLKGALPDGVAKKGRTEESPLPGAIGWPANDDVAVVAAQIREAAGQKIDEDTALLLANTYGMRGLKVAQLVNSNPELARRLVPQRPEILAQVDFGVHEELASTVLDIIKQRTQLFYRDVDQGLSAVAAVADRMAILLQWDAATRQRSIDAYQADVDLNRRWRQDVGFSSPS